MTNEDRAREKAREVMELVRDKSTLEYLEFQIKRVITQALQEAEQRGRDNMESKKLGCSNRAWLAEKKKEENAYRKGLLRASEIRPSRAKMANDWQKKQWYEVGWNNAVVAYSEAIRREAEGGRNE